MSQSTRFEHILLEREQEELLAMLVEAARNVPRDRREKFMFTQSMSGSGIVHAGLGPQGLDAYLGDVEALISEGLLAPSYPDRYTIMFDVTPLGFRYYEELKRRAGQPLERVEATVTSYIEADHFQRAYPAAYRKWAEAEAMLWASDTERQLTTIGHCCREALQELATALVERYQPRDVDADKAHTVARLRAVLDLRKAQLGETEKALLDALLAYWRTVNDLAQRQEHGGQKEGEPLVWEDARRVVFQTAIVMSEADRTLSRGR